MRANEFIVEAFTQPYPITWEKSEYGSYDALARLDDGSNLSINFNLESGGPEGMDEDWHVEFWRDNSLGVTGQGDAYKIFATVMQAIQEFIQEEQPETIVFSASKEVEPGQNPNSRASLYKRLVQRYAQSWGYKVQSSDQGKDVVFKLDRIDSINEISRDRLERYLDRANRQVDTRQERMARARARLNTSYEIYHAKTPNKVVDRFEADTPADAQRYYQDYIERYESDVDYDLRLRRSTGLTESTTFAQMPAQQIAKVAQDSFAQLYPGVKLYGASTVEGVGLSTQKGGAGSASAFAGGDTVRGEFYLTLNAYAEGGTMIVVVEDATAGEYKGAATAIIKSLFAAGERLYKTDSRELVIKDNANQEVWNAIASRVGAEIVSENFADGKKPGRKGLAKRVGVNCKQSISKLRSIAAHSSGERQRMAHWCANMKSGKKNESK